MISLKIWRKSYSDQKKHFHQIINAIGGGTNNDDTSELKTDEQEDIYNKNYQYDGEEAELKIIQDLEKADLNDYLNLICSI